MPLFHNGYIGALLNTFTYVAWYWHILIFIGVIFITLALHELTHFLVFVLMGYENDMLIVFLFCFYKHQGKWRLKIDPKLMILGGGLVWPDLGVIDNNEDFEKARKAMYTSLLSAPLFTAISGVLPLLIGLLFLHKTFIIPIGVYLFIVSMFYTYVSTLESGEIVGDFKAYKRVKSDVVFSQLLLLQYTDISNYQYRYLETYLKENTYYTKVTRAFFAYLLEKNIFYEDEIDMFLYEKVLSIVNNPYQFQNFLSNEEGIILAQHIIFFLHKANHQADSLMFYDTFKKHIETAKTKDVYKQYLIKQTAHLIKLSDESAYINNPKNMQTSLVSFIINHLPSVVEAELKKNNGFSLFPVTCSIENGLNYI